jgi:predicted nucleic-acid-binding Zn-ribbon protein
VKEETRSRILQEKVPYEEYLQIYPSDHACLSFLEKIKWEEGYTCRKCGNLSYSKTDKNFARRCTKCKYTESVTAGTLFHGIKFPLNKAFYIVYDTYDEKSRSTIDKLSEKIDLRRVTVWMFRKKVLDAYSKKTRHQDSGWESLILSED